MTHKRGQRHNIRILHLISSIGFYGAERVILNLITRLTANEFDSYVSMLCKAGRPNYHLIHKAKMAGKTAFAIRCRGRIDSSSFSHLLAIVKNMKIDVLHCHEPKSQLYGLFVSKLTGLPIIATNHNWVGGTFKVRLYEFLNAFYLRFFDEIVAVSNSVKKRMTSFGIPESKISVIHNGIDINEYTQNVLKKPDILKNFQINQNDKIVGSVGRLYPEKGYKYFIDAAKYTLNIMPNVHFFVAGDGPLRYELIDYTKSLGIEKKVSFIGFRDNIASFYPFMDVYLQTSLTEGMPMAILEAMASGLPVVASDVEGIRDIISHEVDGVLVNSRSSADIAYVIKHIFDNQDDAKRLSRNARDKVIRNFSVQKMARQYEIIYKHFTSKYVGRR